MSLPSFLVLEIKVHQLNLIIQHSLFMGFQGHVNPWMTKRLPQLLVL